MLLALLLLAMGPDETAARAKAESIARAQRYLVTAVKSSAQDGDAWYVVVEAKDTRGTSQLVHREAVFRVWVWKDGSTFFDEQWNVPGRTSFSTRSSGDPDPRWPKAPRLARTQPALAPNSKRAPAAFSRERVIALARKLAEERHDMREVAVSRADFDPVKNEWDVDVVGRSPAGCATLGIRFDLTHGRTIGGGTTGWDGGSMPDCMEVLAVDDWGDDEEEAPQAARLYEPSSVTVDDVRALIEKWASDRGVTAPVISSLEYQEPGGWNATLTGTLGKLAVEYRIGVGKTGVLQMRCETKTGGTPPPGVVSRKIALRIASEAAEYRGLYDVKTEAVWRERRCRDREDGWLATAIGNDGRMGIELAIEIQGESGWPRSARDQFLTNVVPTGPTLLERVGPKKDEKKKNAGHVFIDDLGFGGRFGWEREEERQPWRKEPDRRHAALPEMGPDVPQVPERAKDAVLFTKRVVGEAEGRDVRVVLVAEEAQPFPHWTIEVSARIAHGCMRVAFGIDASSGKPVTIRAARTHRRTWIERCELWTPPDWRDEEDYRHSRATWLRVKTHPPSTMLDRDGAEERVREAARARGLTEVTIESSDWDADSETLWEIDGYARRADKRCVSFYAGLGIRETELQVDEEDLSEPGVDCGKWADGEYDEDDGSDDWSD